MKKCSSQNYSKDLHSNSINLSNLKSTSINELVEDIYSVLQDCPFSTDINDSIDENTYQDSIDELIKQVDTKLSEVKLDFELSKQDKQKVINNLKTKLLPIPLTKAEEQISAVIKGTDLVKEEEIQKKRYKQMLGEVYGTVNPGIDSWRKRLFEDSLALATIIDTSGDGMIIDSNDDLNNNIINYQESQYKIIRDYITKYHLHDVDSQDFPKTLYTQSKQNQYVKVKTPAHYNTITAMYNIIESLKNDGSFLNSIENGWNEDIDNIKKITQDRALYKAVNAFINLVYFDDVLNQTLNKFIKISPQPNPIQASIDGYGLPTYKYKYQIAVGNSNARKTWGDDVSDSIEEMSKFSKVLINRIQVYDYKDGTAQWGRLEPKDFVGTIVKLKSVGSLVTDNEFKKSVEKLTTESSLQNGYLNTIFKKLFIDKDKSIIKELSDKGFDYNNMNTLYSIYRTVFDTRQGIKRDNKSWIEVENDYIRKTGIKSRYNLVNTIYGLICSNSTLDYLQSVYDFDTDTVKTSVKDKYSISKTKFDIINDINDNTIKRQDTESLLSMYKLTRKSDDKSYIVNISGINYDINVTGPGINILSKKNVAARNFKIDKLKQLSNISLYTTEQRNKLLSRTNLNNDEQQFVNVLSFIDTMLNTDFSKNGQSLNELAITMKGRPTIFHDLFMSAVRALVIQDIYNDFRNATKDDGTHYAKTELREYLKKSGKFPGLHDVSNLYAYFRSDYDGYQLTTVDTNEQWIIKLANTRALLANDTSKSVISDLQGNKVPNFSPAFLSAELKSQLDESNEKGLASAYLFFSGNKNALLNVTIDSDIKTKYGDVKQVKNMTEKELLYHAFVQNFLIPLHEDGTIYTQSTTQSDKTKFIANHIDLQNIIIDGKKLTDLIKSKSLEQSVIQKINSTIGAAYNKVYNRVVEDYKKVFPSIKGIDDINNILKGTPITSATGNVVVINSEEDLINTVNSYNKANPNDVVTFYKDLHYRQVSGSIPVNENGKIKNKSFKKLAFNELLYEFATNLYNQNDTSRLQQRISSEKRRFVNTLINKGFCIQATDQIKSIMSQTFGLNTNKWIQSFGDEEYVVLAKQNKKNIVYNNLTDQDFEINPMLNAYFLIDNLIGNNLRFSTTGSEINHKIKALAKLDLKSKIPNIEANKSNILLLNP